ncbi:Hypothetical protein, putative [Bodo saltans]|uniref:Uncharacterized protein n=1 Tax=Bodo saltans TaxID=75058 RepID=A0A0S4KHR0_BODSA|nr:Hypothetical protein, putative [Bodo saltans]|eukprot:CUI12823.1 Hypothetical protein, putative [Bodo saltans]
MRRAPRQFLLSVALLRPPPAGSRLRRWTPRLNGLSDEMKANFGRLGTQMNALDANVKAEMKDVRSQMNVNARDFRTQMNALDANIKSEMKDLRTEMNVNAQDFRTQMNALDAKMDALDISIVAAIKDARSDIRTML